MVQGDLFVVELSAWTVYLDSHLESSEIGAIVKFLNFQPFEFFRAVESSERNETSVLFDVRCSKSATFRCNSRELQSAFDTTAIYVVVARWPKAADTPRAESNYRFLGLATISLSGIQASLPQNTCGKDNVKVFNVSGTFQLRDVTGRPVGNIDLSICLSRLTESSPIVVHHSTPFDDIASLKRKPFPKADDTVAQPKAEQKRWMSVSVQTTTDRATQVYEHWTIGVPSGGSDFSPKAAYPLDAEEFGLHKKENDVRFVKRQPRDCDIFMFRQSTNLVDPLDNHLDLGVLQPAPIQLNCTADRPSSNGPHENRPRATKRNRFTASSQRGRIASHENGYHGSSTSESSTRTPIEYGEFSRPAVSERSLGCSPLGAPSRPKSCGSHIPARISQLAIPRKRNPASALLVPKARGWLRSTPVYVGPSRSRIAPRDNHANRLRRQLHQVPNSSAPSRPRSAMQVVRDGGSSSRDDPVAQPAVLVMSKPTAPIPEKQQSHGQSHPASSVSSASCRSPRNTGVTKSAVQLKTTSDESNDSEQYQTPTPACDRNSSRSASCAVFGMQEYNGRWTKPTRKNVVKPNEERASVRAQHTDFDPDIGSFRQIPSAGSPQISATKAKRTAARNASCESVEAELHRLHLYPTQTEGNDRQRHTRVDHEEAHTYSQHRSFERSDTAESFSSTEMPSEELTRSYSNSFETFDQESRVNEPKSPSASVEASLDVLAENNGSEQSFSGQSMRSDTRQMCVSLGLKGMGDGGESRSGQSASSSRASLGGERVINDLEELGCVEKQDAKRCGYRPTYKQSTDETSSGEETMKQEACVGMHVLDDDDDLQIELMRSRRPEDYILDGGTIR